MLAVRKPGLKYVARSDVNAYDASQATLTLDGAFHTLDLSSIIPATAKLVNLRIRAANAATGKHFIIVPHGQVNSYVKMDASIIVVNLAHEQTGIVPCTGQVVDYKADAVAWVAIGVVVLGWFL